MTQLSRLVATLIAVGLFLALCHAQSEVPSALPRFEYRDDHDGRRIADIRLNVVETGGVRSLEMTISAVGPAVQPMPSFEGILGGNRHTAQQIENTATAISATSSPSSTSPA